jgi:hypothetical protein
MSPDLDLVPGASNEEDATPNYGALAESIRAGGDQARLERKLELELNPPSGVNGLPQNYTRML